MITWQWAAFHELDRDDLYEILRVRQEVFVVEQNCAYLDADGLDQCALHLLGWQQDDFGHRQLAAYLRLLPPGNRYPEPSIGRLLTVHSTRGTGLGWAIMHEASAQVAALYPHSPIRISAQHYLEGFYLKLGFVAASDIYEEDGIPHREMVKFPD